MITRLRLSLGVLALALLCAVGYFFGYRLGCDSVVHQAAQHNDAMAWIRHEYHLTPAQFEAIEKLHEAYTVTCDEHCRQIQEALQVRQTLEKESPENKAALLAAEAEIKRLSDVCESSLKVHLTKVAALMNPEDGACYLAMMKPLLERFDHSGTPKLRLSAPSQEHSHTHEPRK